MLPTRRTYRQRAQHKTTKRTKKDRNTRSEKIKMTCWLMIVSCLARATINRSTDRPSPTNVFSGWVLSLLLLPCLLYFYKKKSPPPTQNVYSPQKLIKKISSFNKIDEFCSSSRISARIFKLHIPHRLLTLLKSEKDIG